VLTRESAGHDRAERPLLSAELPEVLDIISECSTAESSAAPRRRARTATHDPRDDHPPVLERLTQTFDRVAAELGELVEEQDTVVRQRS
jgi:hypothetical protein